MIYQEPNITGNLKIDNVLFVGFSFDTTEFVIVPNYLTAIKMIDGKWYKYKSHYITERSVFIVINKDYVPNRLLEGDDLKWIDFYRERKKRISCAVPYIDTGCYNKLHASIILDNGDLLIAIKGIDWKKGCLKGVNSENYTKIKRDKPRTRGMCRKYHDRKVPFELLLFPRTEKEKEAYKIRVIEDFFTNHKIDDEFKEWISDKNNLTYYSLDSKQKKKEDKKSRDYLNIDLDESELALPRNEEEYYLWTFRQERCYELEQDNGDYSVALEDKMGGTDKPALKMEYILDNF